MTDWTDTSGPQPPRWLALATGEQIIVRERAHPKQLVLPVIVALVLIVFGVVLGQLAGDNVASSLGIDGLGDTLSWAVPLAATILAIILLIAAAGGWAAHQYVITTDRIIERTGIVSTTKRIVPLRAITETLVNRTLTDRIFGSGTVHVDVAGARGINLTAIPDAQAIQRDLSALSYPQR